MKTKILRFPSGHFVRKKQHPLTSKMINTLLDACEKQNAGASFGPADIKGSFAVLITRGLIVREKVTVNEHLESGWQVTGEAVEMLRTMGIKISC